MQCPNSPAAIPPAGIFHVEMGKATKPNMHATLKLVPFRSPREGPRELCWKLIKVLGDGSCTDPNC